MKRVDYVEMLSTPKSYQPPDVSTLSTNTEYPNLNSKEYRLKSLDTTLKIQKFYEVIDVNTLGKVALACNDYQGRIWNGSVWGFENIKDVGDATKSSYTLAVNSTITNIKFVESNMLLISDSRGTLQICSTEDKVRSPYAYSLYNIGCQSEHCGIINSLELIHMNPTKAITGSNDACIKIWDMGAGDLYSIHTYRYAHSDSIRGLSSSNTSEHIFASCSRDKSFNIWDYRVSKPVIDYYDNNRFGFTTIYWTNSSECNENILLGDESGRIYTVDIRNPKVYLNTLKYFDCPLHKIKFETNLFVALGATNRVQVIDTQQDFKVVYENSDATDFVRDVHWEEADTFYTIGWDTKLSKHTILNE